jgi:concanavalin A-like lectin/glucanase superfamily protein
VGVAGAVVLLVASVGFLVFEPWHGPIILALSEQHGVDAADLPAVALMALALAICAARIRDAPAARWWWAGAAAAVALGALLFAGILNPRIGSPLVPAGGGTFGRETQHVDGVGSEPVGRWTHLAVTYDGSIYHLYVDGLEISTRSASGSILSTSDPLWIGGNHPYGEYFRGIVDEVRVYSDALSAGQVQAAMTTPTPGQGSTPGLVAAYGFDARTGRSVADASGNGNVAAAIDGPQWTNGGRFGGGMLFDGAGQLLRVPASASLDLRKAMTLMAWIKPTQQQSGWRTIIARQTDAYFLAAGGGREDASRLSALDRVRFALILCLVVWTAYALVRGRAPWATGRSPWYWPVALFVAGSVLDAAFAPSDTLIGPALVATWFAATAVRREETVTMYVLAAAFAALTIVSIAQPGAVPLPHNDDGVVRSAALGLVLVVSGLVSARRGAAQTRAVGP